MTRASEEEAKSPFLFNTTVFRSNATRTDVSRTSQSLTEDNEPGLGQKLRGLTNLHLSSAKHRDDIQFAQTQNRGQGRHVD